MKTRSNIFANIPGVMAVFLAALLLSGCYTQFSQAGQPENQAYYEAYPEESGAYESESYPGQPESQLESPGYAVAYYDDYPEDNGYREDEPDRIIINKYYIYDQPFGVYYNPPVYDPDPYVSISLHFFSGYRYGYYSPIYGYPPHYWHPRHSRHWRMAYHYPAYFDFGFYFTWGYWDPWYATIYYPPVVILAPPYYPPYYPGWCPPFYDPWYSGHHGHHGGHHSNPGYGNDPWPTGPRDWGRRDPVVVGNGGRPGAPGSGSHGGSNSGGSNSGGSNLKSPQRGTIQAAGPATESQRSPRNPSSGQNPGLVNSGTRENDRRRETIVREPVKTPEKKNPRKELGAANAATPPQESAAGSRFNAQPQERRPAQPSAGNTNNSRNGQQAGQQPPAHQWSAPLEPPKPVSQPAAPIRSNDSGSSNGSLRQPAAPQRNSENNSNSSFRTENKSSSNSSSPGGSNSYQPQPSRSTQNSSAPAYRSQPAPPRSSGNSSVQQTPQRSGGNSSVQQPAARSASGKSEGKESSSQKSSNNAAKSSDRAKRR